MRDSIKRQITILSVGIVAFTMIIALLINGRFMEGYYIANKEEDLKNMYQMLNESVGSSVIYTESLEAMKTSCRAGKYIFYRARPIRKSGHRYDERGRG